MIVKEKHSGQLAEVFGCAGDVGSDIRRKKMKCSKCKLRLVTAYYHGKAVCRKCFFELRNPEKAIHYRSKISIELQGGKE